MNTPIYNVIFDLGGVLLDWDEDAIVAAVFDDPETRAAVKRAVFKHDDWLALDRGALDEEEAVDRFATRSGLTPAAMERLMEQVRIALAPKPDSLTLLEELHGRGVPLYCLSNMQGRNWTYLQENYDFWDRFLGIVISADLKLLKPEPDIYLHLLSAYDLDPVRSVFIDDTPANVTGARAVGLNAIRFTSAESCRRQLDALLG